MPKTNAELQKAYRSRRDQGDGDRRINMWVSSSSALALARLSRHSGITKRQMLERLVCAADDAILNVLEFDTPELDSYLNLTQ